MHADLNRIADLVLFARIVQAGGISLCAREMGMERTTVSRRLARLERDLGVRLADRHPRSFTITKAGWRCYKRCEALIEAAVHARSEANHDASRNCRTPIQLYAPADVLEHYIFGFLKDFGTRHRDVPVRVDLLDTSNADVRSHDDVLVTWTVPKNVLWRTTVMGKVPHAICVGPEYVRRFGWPRSPEDLEHHTCILAQDDESSNVWQFGSGENTVRKKITNGVAVRSVLEAREAIVAGLGIGRLPRHMCVDHIRADRLALALEEHSVVGRDLLLVTRPLEQDGSQVSLLANSIRAYMRSRLSD